MINTSILAALLLSTIWSCQDGIDDPQPDQNSAWELLCDRKWRLAETRPGSNSSPSNQNITYHSPTDSTSFQIWEFNCDGSYVFLSRAESTPGPPRNFERGEWWLTGDNPIICITLTELNGQPWNYNSPSCIHEILVVNDTILSVEFQGRGGMVNYVFKPYDDTPVPTKK